MQTEAKWAITWPAIAWVYASETTSDCSSLLTACPSYTWGENCMRQCLCHHNATCHHKNGVCNCSSVVGYSGTQCSNKCQSDKFGRDCQSTCNCSEGHVCHHKTGKCLNFCQINENPSKWCLPRGESSERGNYPNKRWCIQMSTQTPVFYIEATHWHQQFYL